MDTHVTAVPISFEMLHEIASEWAQLVPDGLADSGALALLRTARSLFAHAWFDYEFMAVACLIAFQAMEAALREHYPDAEKVPLRKLTRRAAAEGIFSTDVATLAENGVELRNLFAHPLTQATPTVGIAASILENVHRMVVLVVGTSGTS